MSSSAKGNVLTFIRTHDCDGQFAVAYGEAHWPSRSYTLFIWDAE